MQRRPPTVILVKPPPTALRSLLWRVGVGTPKTELVRSHIGHVAANLDAKDVASKAAEALGLPGLYRSPLCWGGSAPQPKGMSFKPFEWSARCQAASFEIAVPLGDPALPFIEENAFGPLETLHGLALRALLRLGTRGHGDEALLSRAMDRIAHLEAPYSEEALDGLTQVNARFFQRVHERLRRPIIDGLERIVARARSVRARLVPLHSLVRLAPDRARQFLPDLRKLFVRDEHALDAALLVRAMEPKDQEARDILRRWADEHPDRKIREALEMELRPPQFVRGGLA